MPSPRGWAGIGRLEEVARLGTGDGLSLRCGWRMGSCCVGLRGYGGVGWAEDCPTAVLWACGGGVSGVECGSGVCRGDEIAGLHLVWGWWEHRVSGGTPY